jgi:multidrug efflux pump subunit AcrA (membrane-fusion protein)
MMRKITKICLFLTIALFLSCGQTGPKQKTRFVPSVNVVTVRRNTVTRTVELLGTVYGDRQAVAFSKITGKVTEIAKPEGSLVSEGDAIVYVVNDIPGMDYKPGPVLAPISGVVGKVYVEIGQSVAPGVPIAIVTSYSDKVKIKAPISDQDLNFLKLGARAEVFVATYPQETFLGRVTQFSPVLDPVSRSATVEVTVPNPDKKLVPGMAASLRLILEQKPDVLAVPLSALFTNGFSKVMVIEGTTAHLREIKVGLIGDEWIEVVAGLREGEKVATVGKERIQDGEEVKPVEVSSQ